MTLHALLIGAIIVGGARAKQSVAAEKKIDAFITQGAAPPPPPPPPPKKASGGSPKPTPVQQPKPIVQPQPSFTAPREIPKEVPKVDPLPVTRNMPVPELPTVETVPTDSGSGPGGDAVNGVEGGVDGGVAGGIVGGEVGGVVGGEIGGVKGGELGGKLGGELGGTGTGTQGNGTGGNEAPVAPPPPPPPPPPVPDGPLRVGGDVKAPQTISRVEPTYTDSARKAKVSGVVVVEAIIDSNGNVDRVKVIKGLPMGLSEEAVEAVKKWKFKPGTLNGKSVDTIFNLTVTFKLE